jgi:flagellar export protein FliJ
MSDTSFRFPLDQVLELRAERERDRAVDLVRARREADGAHKERTTLEEARTEGRDRIHRAHANGGPVGMLRNFGMIADVLDEQLRQADQACRNAEAMVSRSLRDYHEAAVDRQTLDRLRARRMDEWQAEQHRREQSVLDEVALRRHARPGPAGDGEDER